MPERVYLFCDETPHHLEAYDLEVAGYVALAMFGAYRTASFMGATAFKVDPRVVQHLAERWQHFEVTGEPIIPISPIDAETVCSDL